MRTALITPAGLAAGFRAIADIVEDGPVHDVFDGRALPITFWPTGLTQALRYIAAMNPGIKAEKQKPGSNRIDVSGYIGDVHVILGLKGPEVTGSRLRAEYTSWAGELVQIVELTLAAELADAIAARNAEQPGEGNDRG